MCSLTFVLLNSELWVNHPDLSPDIVDELLLEILDRGLTYWTIFKADEMSSFHGGPIPVPPLLFLFPKLGKEGSKVLEHLVSST